MGDLTSVTIKLVFFIIGFPPPDFPPWILPISHRNLTLNFYYVNLVVMDDRREKEEIESGGWGQQPPIDKEEIIYLHESMLT